MKGRAADMTVTHRDADPRQARSGWIWRSKYLLLVLSLLIIALVWSLFHARYVKRPPAAAVPAIQYSLSPRSVGRLPGVPSINGAQAHPPANPQPNHIYIPSLGTDAPVVLQDASVSYVGSQKIVKLGVPAPAEVAMYSGGADLDSVTGTVLLAGHINLDGVRGALWNLSDTRPGADIWVTNSEASLTHWRVYANPVVNKESSAWPVDVFDPTGQRRLVVASCTGALHYVPGYGYSYDDNQFVYAAQIDY
jgi:hypothetical protein